MYNFYVKNSDDEILNLTGNEQNYQIIEIDGLNAPSANIMQIQSSYLDGSIITNSVLNTRNIVIKLKINGDVETNRNYLYRFFRTKRETTIFYENELKKMYITGYVESIDIDFYGNKGQIVQISIICEKPYFKSIDETTEDLTQIVPNLEFPLSIGGKGATYTPTYAKNTDPSLEYSIIIEKLLVTIINKYSETGLLIRIRITGGTVTNPIIRNVVTHEYIELNGSFLENRIIEINSQFGNKSILYYEGQQATNILDLASHLDWLVLREGINTYTYEAKSGREYMHVEIVYREHHLGA